jgi:hypothetical protein
MKEIEGEMDDDDDDEDEDDDHDEAIKVRITIQYWGNWGMFVLGGNWEGKEVKIEEE